MIRSNMLEEIDDPDDKSSCIPIQSSMHACMHIALSVFIFHSLLLSDQSKVEENCIVSICQ